jgi:hypothetical protein
MVYPFTVSATATITAGSGMAYVYVSNNGLLMVGHSMTVSCSSGCTAQSGVTAFPPNSIPLSTWSATNGAWDSSGGTDWRAFQSAAAISTGAGLTSVTSYGQTQIGVDTGAISLRVAAPLTSTDTCALGSWAMDASFVYLCYATNQWQTIPQSAWKTTPAGGNLADPGSNGVLKRIALNTTAIATGNDFPVMVGYGAGHSGGAVPDPGASGGASTDYLGRDAQWHTASNGGGAATVIEPYEPSLGICTNNGGSYGPILDGGWSGNMGWGCNNVGALGGSSTVALFYLGSQNTTSIFGFRMAVPTGLSRVDLYLYGYTDPATSGANSLSWTATVGCTAVGSNALGGSQNAGTTASISSTPTDSSLLLFSMTNLNITGCTNPGLMYIELTRGGTFPGWFTLFRIRVEKTRSLP